MVKAPEKHPTGIFSYGFRFCFWLMYLRLGPLGAELPPPMKHIQSMHHKALLDPNAFLLHLSRRNSLGMGSAGLGWQEQNH